jgi:hypothetical protein
MARSRRACPEPAEGTPASLLADALPSFPSHKLQAKSNKSQAPSVPGFPTSQLSVTPLMWFSLKRTTCSDRSGNSRQEIRGSRGICSSADHYWERGIRCSNRIVISTGAYPDFLPRSTGQSSGCAFLFKERRMSSANATNVHRKSGVAQWRDLRFLLVLT